MTTPPSLESLLQRPTRVTGEPLVWLSSLGLTTGLALIATLLTVVLVQGVSAFWPASFGILRLTTPEGQLRLAGSIVQRRPKHELARSGGEEIQVFTGNKERGPALRWFEAQAVQACDHPAELLVLQRLTQGPAVGLPVELRDGKEVIPASDPQFLSRLQATLRQAAKVRTRLEGLEKDGIGGLARRLEALPAGTPARQDLEDRIRRLAAEADALRSQASPVVVLQPVPGPVLELPTSELLAVRQPNQEGWLARCGLMLGHMGRFLWEDPREANTEGGIFPALFGTFFMTLLMCLVVTPVGLVAAIYLREYARQGLLVRMVRIAINNLAGVPSIVFGVFGLGFFIYIVGGGLDRWLFADRLPAPTFGTGGVLWASLTLALLTLPVVIVATEESLAAVPRGAKEASLALGATKWQTIRRVAIPASLPGILTGVILAMARGAGEVAPLMVVGVVKLAPSLPLDGQWPFLHLDRKFMHLGFHIYDLGFQSPDSEAVRPMVFATTLLLILVVLVLNLGAILVRERLRRTRTLGAF